MEAVRVDLSRHRNPEFRLFGIVDELDLADLANGDTPEGHGRPHLKPPTEPSKNITTS